MKKITKIILLVLTLAILAVIPFAVSASESEPSLTIKAANLSFEDSVYPIFAVSGEGVDLESVKLLVWTSAKDGVDAYDKGTENAVLDSYDNTTVSGVACKKFKYTKLYSRNMADAIYVRAYAVVDGEEVYSGLTKYSIIRYAYNKLGLTGTASTNADFREMLTEMLQYGASSQKYFKYNTDRLATDKFYKVTVEGGLLADGTPNGLYLAGDTVTMIAPETDESGRSFVAWLDSYGIEVATTATASIAVEKANVTYTASYEPKQSAGAGVEALAYTVNSDGTTCTITGIGRCTKTAIAIPEYLDGYKVTAIGEKAFADCTDITYIKIPDTVKTIGTRAFYGCTGLTEMTIPASVTSIGTQIFYKASNLSTVYYNSTYSSSDNQFLNLSHITKIVFGGKYVPDYICYNASAIKTVEILDSVTSIGSNAFYKCTSLTSIEIPDSVTSIGNSAFSGCPGLTSVYITDIDAWCNISFSEFSSNPMCNRANLYLNGELVTELTIPDTVTKIKGSAFQGCTSITSVVIPNSVTSIGNYAFVGCSSLTSIEIPDSVTSIGDRAFSGCTSLTSVVIPDSVPRIGWYAFSGCTSLTSVVIPDSVTSIGDEAFYNCTSLASVVIGDSVTSIGSDAFRECTSLTSIKYRGTESQWKAISKGSYWASNTGNYTITYNYTGE